VNATPQRITLSRKAGWRLQSASLALNGLPAVNCTRPGRWGNPYKVGIHGDANQCVRLFRENLFRYRHAAGTLDDLYLDEITLVDIASLRGKNLACWCKPGAPCHADTLLALANAPR